MLMLDDKTLLEGIAMSWGSQHIALKEEESVFTTLEVEVNGDVLLKMLEDGKDEIEMGCLSISRAHHLSSGGTDRSLQTFANAQCTAVEKSQTENAEWRKAKKMTMMRWVGSPLAGGL